MRSALPFALVLVAACSEPAADEAEPSPAANALAEPVVTRTPAAPAPDTRAARVEAWVKRVYPDMGTLMLKWGGADLDGDGKEEVLAYVGGPMLCGTGGCNLVVLKDDGANLIKIGDVSVAQMPVGVLNTKTSGMRDLAVSVAGGGAKAAIMKVPFDGKAYAGNPTVGPATPVDTIGTEVIADGALKKLD